MNKINILFLDYCISRTKTINVLCKKYNLCLFDFKEKLNESMLNETIIGIEIKKHVDKGELIPNHLINSFIEDELTKTRNQNLLLVGFPRTKNQFYDLEKILSSLNIEVEHFWYFKHNDAQKFMTEYYNIPENKTMIDKYCDDINQAFEAWTNRYIETKNYINNIYKITNEQKWRIFNIDFEPNTTEKYIENIIEIHE